MKNLVRPIAVFDSGIGSYSIVNSIREVAPDQDIIYLADRKSFPYGNKNAEQLFEVVSSAILYLTNNFKPEGIIVASNVPSITMLPRLQSLCHTPIKGIFPPVTEALSISKNGSIAILCVASLANSPSLNQYINKLAPNNHNIEIFNASKLVELVESGEFLFNKEKVTFIVKEFIDNIIYKFPKIDTFTLSSTHLPWLYEYFKNIYPDYSFINPAKKVIDSLPLNNDGTGQIICIATSGEEEKYSINNFRDILSKLGNDKSIKLISEKTLSI